MRCNADNVASFIDDTIEQFLISLNYDIIVQTINQ